MKIETILSGCADLIRIDSITVYPFDDAQRECNVLKMSLADFRENPEPCAREWVKALRDLPVGSYTVVIHCDDGDYIEDVVVGKRGALSVKPYECKTNDLQQRRPCLRIEVTR